MVGRRLFPFGVCAYFHSGAKMLVSGRVYKLLLVFLDVWTRMQSNCYKVLSQWSKGYKLLLLVFHQFVYECLECFRVDWMICDCN